MKKEHWQCSAKKKDRKERTLYYDNSKKWLIKNLHKNKKISNLLLFLNIADKTIKNIYTTQLVLDNIHSLYKE